MHLLVAAGFDWVSLLGPFHVVMLHYPIGFLTLAGLLEAWTVRNPGAGVRRAIGFTLGINALATWLVVGLGLLRAARGEFAPEVLSLHRLFGILVAALRGGASGKAAIVPGEPLTSPLVQALLLPADRDEAMPPEGKDRLSDSEVMAVIRWIQGGAPFGPDQR
jgi:hypothetical protein